MPTYDYVCDGCGHAFELFQSITADPEKTCPECRRKKLRRLIGTGAAILVGGRTAPPDHGSTNESISSEADGSGDSADGGKSDTEGGSKDAPAETSPQEKKISGSTSTPTHEAREGRGVGNLLDAARRQRKESSDDSKSSSKPTEKKTAKKAVPKTPKKPASKSADKSGGSARSGKAQSTGRKSSGGSKPRK